MNRAKVACRSALVLAERQQRVVTLRLDVAWVLGLAGLAGLLILVRNRLPVLRPCRAT